MKDETQRSACLDYLLWAVDDRAGASSLPNFENADLTTLASWFAYHRVGGRFLAKLNTYGLAVDQLVPLVEMLYEQQAKDRALRQEQLNALRVALPALGPANPPILFKGIATAALLQDQQFVRPAHDIDMIFRDRYRAWRVLRDLGFEGTVEPGYEFAHLSRRPVNLDIHCSFPAWSFPLDLPEVIPAGTQGTLQKQGPWAASTSHIPYEDIEASHEMVDVPGVGAVPVAGKEMSVLLLCAHILRGFRHLRLRFHCEVRLFELAEVMGLLSRPNFDFGLLSELMRRNDAEDSVAFVSHLLSLSFGRTELVLNLPGLRARPPARILQTHSCFAPAWLGSSFTSWREWLMPRSTTEFVCMLQPNEIIVGFGGVEHGARMQGLEAGFTDSGPGSGSGSDGPRHRIAVDWAYGSYWFRLARADGLPFSGELLFAFNSGDDARSWFMAQQDGSILRGQESEFAINRTRTEPRGVLPAIAWEQGSTSWRAGVGLAVKESSGSSSRTWLYPILLHFV